MTQLGNARKLMGGTTLFSTGICYIYTKKFLSNIPKKCIVMSEANTFSWHSHVKKNSHQILRRV